MTLKTFLLGFLLLCVVQGCSAAIFRYPIKPACPAQPTDICSRIYYPLCGTDFKTHSNLCTLCFYIHESGTDVRIIGLGECESILERDMSRNVSHY
ncbi:ovomucoid-like [Stigmatopora argus]